MNDISIMIDVRGRAASVYQGCAIRSSLHRAADGLDLYVMPPKSFPREIYYFGATS